VPAILYNTKKDGMQYLNRRVLCGVKIWDGVCKKGYHTTSFGREIAHSPMIGRGYESRLNVW
jgi:hypothetical protein